MRYIFFTAILLFMNLNAAAHQFSTANLTMEQISSEHHRGFIELSLNDLQQTLRLDPDQDGKLTWGEVKQSHQKLVGYLTNHIHLRTQSEPCRIEWADNVSLVDSYGELLLRQPLTTQCNGHFSLQYQALFDTTNSHKLLINWLLKNGQTQTVIDSPDFVWNVDAGTNSGWETFLFYLYQGMIHIWIGLDHVLFLLILLFHFKWSYEQNTKQQKPVRRLKLKPLLWLITGFTLAHSITLTLTALGLIDISPKWAEVGIAFSVAFAALNVFTNWIKRIILMTMGFGLLHGLGFAGALSSLGLSKSHQVTSIVGFNLGVEIGQIAILLIAVPMLLLISQNQRLYKYFLLLSSSIIFLLGIFWIWQRI
ncbi:HupE/UreJ family protein [Kangiella sediminilitoris]|uniref:HupE / UreJ protein n=1 Tax=Kangiella sediminilitoris TaxID=1144748 RepID=A0A1B3B8Y3_9GAMM|nr:HupE/UreJ family protein [Kangiella sediminilitoris]AOE49245.1 hypothetical protein KS2013_521 [Kangiella sediminilitoris]